VLNPLKVYYLMGLGQTKILNEFKFIVRPTEKIRIT
jgi:hypothetical protein